MMCTFSFAQIQHGGLPKYLIDQNEIEIHEVDHSMKIENNLHPMVLHYADEYSVDIDVMDEAIKVIESNQTIFTIGIRSMGAKALGFIFDEFN